MALRKSSILKFFALLLFTFELLAPVFLSSGIEGTEEGSKSVQLHVPTVLSVFSSLLYEEAGSEEGREGKEGQKIFQLVADFSFVEVFSCLVQSYSNVNLISFRQNLPTRVSLNTLYSIFRI